MAMGDREFRAFKLAHPGTRSEPKSYVYSAGGICPASSARAARGRLDDHRAGARDLRGDLPQRV